MLLRGQKGNSLVIMLGVIVLLFLSALAAMFFLIPRKEKVIELKKEEMVKKVVKLSPHEIEELTEALRQRENLLKEKEKIVKEQEERIKTLNKELVRNKNEILKYQDVISQTVTQIASEEQKNIKKLAKVFGLMSPEEAVPIIRKLDDPTVVGVLSSMKERSSAKVLGEYAGLGEIHAERVARISEMMKKMTTSNTTPQ